MNSVSDRNGEARHSKLRHSRHLGGRIHGPNAALEDSIYGFNQVCSHFIYFSGGRGSFAVFSPHADKKRELDVSFQLGQSLFCQVPPVGSGATLIYIKGAAPATRSPRAAPRLAKAIIVISMSNFVCVCVKEWRVR
jgi:hypothetical protein